MTPWDAPSATLGSWGLLFLLLAPLSCHLCPAPCECSEPARTVKCVQKELTSVPAGLPRYTRNLFITGNQIGHIGSQDLRGLPNLVTLSLANNRISLVESQAFSALHHLRYLDLSHNDLTSIHPDAFSARNNSIQELNLSSSLSNSSAIRPVATALAQGGFQNLTRLELTSNEIVYLPFRLLSGLSRLEHLDLRNNSLVDLRNSTFSALDLKYLDLTMNAFKTLRSEALSALGRQRHLRLFLKDNPFVCDCNIEDLVSWLNRSQQVVDVDKLTCAFPESLKNTTLVDLVGLSLDCHFGQHGEHALHTSYAALGIVLGVIGVIFLFVLYLNRKGIKTWMNTVRDTCQNLMDEYRYHYEIDSNHRISQVSALDI
ncbi:trophoblast glycoprotein [Anolis carolinensis]|uniref:Trophoblast glycoprotein n=1 Tax=Anolis carolinensis TaxID=28377 RepID=H9GPS7_ANOCA|nr:PREDICTED: trophoblast glycoprotein-like [Anolis carolinensis]|eukprot:XP_003227251.1 PREDICTED: trophoblast glycoprotein-like [Anolis carolinensis]